MGKIYSFVFLFVVMNVFSQINSPNGNNLFYYNGAADVTFRYLPRGNGGRAFVHAENNILALNFGGDFTGGTRIGNDVFFKDGGNSFIYSGNFGIGTAEPINPLTVYGISSFFPRLAGGGGDARSFYIKYDLVNPNFISNNYPVILGTGAGDQPLVMDAARIGIGTNNPSTKLDVNGTISVRGSDNTNLEDHGKIFFENSNHGIRRIGNIVDLFTSGGPESGITFTLRSYNAPTNSYINMNQAMKITSDGNVGIGTISPSAKLETYNGIPGITSFKTIGINGYMLIDNVGSGENYYDASSFQEFQIGGAPKMRINSNGNVGIGTVNPTSKLTVAGNINSREVKVTVDAGADFVFEKNYNLPSLNFLDNYIKENKHLPEIASAKEMQANGINLSEMNIKLLQKVEEMTLYMIEQNKRIEKLEMSNN